MKTGAMPRSFSIPVLRAATSGFSLVELLITIVIVGILAAIAVPSYREFVAGQRIRTASFDLMAVLTLARSEAIKRGASAAIPVTVIPAGGAWANGWAVTAPDGTVVSRQGALAGLVITCKFGTPAATVACPAGGFAYQGNGRLTAAAQADAPSLEISSASSAQLRCISIDLSGRPNAKTGGC